eukprot:532291-Rhodomonas_salina.1
MNLRVAKPDVPRAPTGNATGQDAVVLSWYASASSRSTLPRAGPRFSAVPHGRGRGCGCARVGAARVALGLDGGACLWPRCSGPLCADRGARPHHPRPCELRARAERQRLRVMLRCCLVCVRCCWAAVTVWTHARALPAQCVAGTVWCNQVSLACDAGVHRRAGEGGGSAGGGLRRHRRRPRPHGSLQVRRCRAVSLDPNTALDDLSASFPCGDLGLVAVAISTAGMRFCDGPVL